MNEIKTFKAESMQEALAIVRRELGTDAVILNTRQISHRRLIPFLKRRQEVEVTAGVSVGTRPTAVAAPRAAASAFDQTVGSFSAEVSDASTVLNSPAAVTRPSPVQRPSPPIVSTDPNTPLGRAAALAMELERRNVDKAQLEKSLNALEVAAVAAAPALAPATPEPVQPFSNPKIEPGEPVRIASHRI